MVIGKFVSKLIQSLPSWEVTKYYGRVCIYQLKCLKYRVQTSEAWFNFKCKYMPQSLRNDAELKESLPFKKGTQEKHRSMCQKEKKTSSTSKECLDDNDEGITELTEYKVHDDPKCEDNPKNSTCKDKTTKRGQKVRKK